MIHNEQEIGEHEEVEYPPALRVLYAAIKFVQRVITNSSSLVSFIDDLEFGVGQTGLSQRFCPQWSCLMFFC